MIRNMVLGSAGANSFASNYVYFDYSQTTKRSYDSNIGEEVVDSEGNLYGYRLEVNLICYEVQVYKKDVNSKNYLWIKSITQPTTRTGASQPVHGSSSFLTYKNGYLYLTHTTFGSNPKSFGYTKIDAATGNAVQYVDYNAGSVEFWSYSLTYYASTTVRNIYVDNNNTVYLLLSFYDSNYYYYYLFISYSNGTKQIVKLSTETRTRSDPSVAKFFLSGSNVLNVVIDTQVASALVYQFSFTSSSVSFIKTYSISGPNGFAITLPDYTKVFPISVSYYDTQTRNVMGIRKTSSDFSTTISTKYFSIDSNTNGYFWKTNLSYNKETFNLTCSTTDTTNSSTGYTLIANLSSGFETINGCIKLVNYQNNQSFTQPLPNVFSSSKYNWLRTTSSSASNANLREAFFVWNTINDFSTSTQYYNSQTSITRGSYITSFVPPTLATNTSTYATAYTPVGNVDMSSMTLVTTLPTVSEGSYSLYDYGNLK